MREFFAQATQGEIDFIRGQYKGKVSMADKWFGVLLDRLDQLNAWDDTMVVVTTDHGHDLGEREAFGKQHPHYDSHANIPLLVWHPGMAKHLRGQAAAALTTTVDLNPTLIEAMGASGYQAPHGRSFLAVAAGERRRHRDAALYGMYGFGAAVTDGRHVLIQGYDNAHPLHLYSTRMPRLSRRAAAEPGFANRIESGFFIPGVDMPVWKIPANPLVGARSQPACMLYDRSDPPFQEVNRFESDAALRRRMQTLLREVMAEEGTPPEQFARLGLPS